MADYKDEEKSLTAFEPSIKKVEFLENNTFIISVNLNNSHSREMLIKMIKFSVREKDTEVILVSGLEYYADHGEGYTLKGNSIQTETFSKEARTQITTNTTVETRARVITIISTKYFDEVKFGTETYTTITLNTSETM
jgi:hypothetical protein